MDSVGFCLADFFVLFFCFLGFFSLLTAGSDLFISFLTLGNRKTFSHLAPGLVKAFSRALIP